MPLVSRTNVDSVDSDHLAVDLVNNIVAKLGVVDVREHLVSSQLSRLVSWSWAVHTPD